MGQAFIYESYLVNQLYQNIKYLFIINFIPKIPKNQVLSYFYL